MSIFERTHSPRFVMFIVLLLLFVERFEARSLFVDAHGVDVGNCSSIAMPCATMAYAFSNASSLADGDTIELLGVGPFFARGIVVSNEDIIVTASTYNNNMMSTINCTSSSPSSSSSPFVFQVDANRFSLKGDSLRVCQNFVDAPVHSSFRFGFRWLQKHVGSRRDE